MQRTVLWDNRVTAHVSLAHSIYRAVLTVRPQSAQVDYGESKERRHGARITPQAERPIPGLDGLELDA